VPILTGYCLFNRSLLSSILYSIEFYIMLCTAHWSTVVVLHCACINGDIDINARGKIMFFPGV